MNWYQKWNKGAFFWSLLATIINFGLIGAFTFFFDTALIKIGQIFVYFLPLFQSILLYFTYSRLRVKWIGTILFGIPGIIGMPIDIYFEWIEEQILISPLGGFGWFIIFLFIGLSADLSLWLAKPGKNEGKAILLSSFVLTFMSIFLNAIALLFFYINLDFFLGYIKFSYFLIPFALFNGVCGGFIGWHINKDFKSRLTLKKSK